MYLKDFDNKDYWTTQTVPIYRFFFRSRTFLRNLTSSHGPRNHSFTYFSDNMESPKHKLILVNNFSIK